MTAEGTTGPSLRSAGGTPEDSGGNFGRRLSPPAATRQADRTQEIRSLGQPTCRCFEIPATL